MAEIGIIRGGPMVAGIEVSVIISETHNMSAKATQQAIESGAAVADHVILDPLQLSVSCEVSNIGGSDTARDVFEAFKTALTAREPMEVITEHAIYRDMVFLSLNQLHAAPFKGALQITAQLQQIRQVEFRIVGRQAAKLSGSGNTNKTAAAEVNAGKQEKTQVKGSAAQKIVGRVSSVLGGGK